jgi:hypothetical protein
MKLRPFITAALIAFTAVPLVSSAQQNTPVRQGTQADLNALPPALRAALLSGNAAAIEQAINTLAAGNATQAGTLAGQVARAASFVAQTNPAAAAAGARAAVAVANTPAVIQANPSAAAAAAAQATQVAALPSVIAAAPAVAAQIAQQATQVAQAPAVIQAAPAVSGQIAASATRVVANRAVIDAAPAIAEAVATSALQITSNQAVQAAAAQTGATRTLVTTEILATQVLLTCCPVDPFCASLRQQLLGLTSAKAARQSKTGASAPVLLWRAAQRRFLKPVSPASAGRCGTSPARVHRRPCLADARTSARCGRYAPGAAS